MNRRQILVISEVPARRENCTKKQKGAETRGSRDSIPTLHRGGPKLKFRPSDRALQHENFLDFPQVNPDGASEAHDHLLAHLSKLLLLIILPFCKQPESLTASVLLCCGLRRHVRN
jgi:hypothetical protein